MPRRSRRWATLETACAAALGGERIHRRWDLFESAPDFLVRDFGMVGDTKAYVRFAHHRLFDCLQSKYCGEPGAVPVLVTAEPHKEPLATIRLSFLAALLNRIRKETEHGQPA